MLKDAVDTYLAVRRAGGYKLQDDDFYLNSFAQFATAQGDTHVVAQTAIAWARQARSEPQRASRLKIVIRFARFSRATDPRHELPPLGVFNPQRQRPIPSLFSDEEVQALMTHAAQLGPAGCILAIPAKRTDSRLISYLTLEEMQAVLNAPNLQCRDGIRDRAMLHLCFSAGLRVSELVNLPLTALEFEPSPTVHIQGKGRRERLLPLWKQTAIDLRAWLAVRGKPLVPEFFVNARNQTMTRSGFNYILQKHVQVATGQCLALKKKKISPHVLRHTAAMLVLQATGDIRKVSLWLGHADIQTTEAYLRADPTEKLETMETVVPPTLKRGQFRAPDKLIASLHDT